MSGYIVEGKLHGCVAYVQKEGKILLNKAYGFQSIERKQKLKSDAIFNIASMAKTITAAGALKLYEEGKFLPDDPVKKYLPELSNLKVLTNIGTDSSKVVPLKRDITIRDLFRHTAGFGYVQYERDVKNEVDSLYVVNKLSESRTSGEFLNKISKIPLKYQPGSKWEYSYSIDILGFLIERITRRTLHDYLTEALFLPLEMNSTGFYLSKDNALRMTSLYSFTDNKLQLSKDPLKSHFLKKPTIHSGGGGMKGGIGALLSTAGDYANFCTMLLHYGNFNGKEILKPQTVELLISNQIAGIEDRSFPLSGYGFGVGVNPSLNQGKTKVISWTGAYNTIFVVNYDSDLIAIFLTQHQPWGYLNIMDEFVSVLERTLP